MSQKTQDIVNTTTFPSSKLQICERCEKNPAFLGYGICNACLEKQREEEEVDSRAKDPEHYMRQWGFPKRFVGWSIDILLPQYQKLIQNLLDAGSFGGLYITGKSGTGKTCIATVLAKEKIKRGEEVWFKNVSDLLFEIKGTFDAENKILNDYGLICAWAKKPILILDDIGSEKITEYVRQSLYVLINKRYLDDLPTIITSNLSLKELSVRLDDRVASRLSEMCEAVDLGEKDLRVYRRKPKE